MKIGRCVVVLLCITFFFCLDGGQTRSCSKQLGNSFHHPKSPQGDSAPVVCVSNKTCCTKQLEETLKKQVVLDMKNGMSKKYDEVKQSVMTIHGDLKDYFREMIGRSFIKTVDLLGKSHRNLTHSTKPLLRHLFKDMETFIADSNVDLNSSVSVFFQESFPLLYPLMDPSEKTLSDGYKTCLKKSVSTIRPFGDKPEELVKTLIELLSPVQIFLGGLVVGASVITTARDFSFANGSDVALLKMKYCPLCQGMTDVKPCHHYCLDLVEKCMASEMQLHDDWNDYIKSLVSLADALSKSDLLDFTSEMYKYLFHTATLVLTSKDTLLPKVVKQCGMPTYKTAGSTSQAPGGPDPALQTSHTNTIISMKMEGVKPKVDFFADLFSDLPRGLCEDDQWAASRSEIDTCWNGEAESRYTGLKNLGTLKPSPSDTEKLKSLVATIKEAIQLIKTSTVVLQGGDEDEDGSGSGTDTNVISGSGECGDDEDCGSAASGDGTDNTIDVKSGKGGGSTDDMYFVSTHSPQDVREDENEVPSRNPNVNADEPMGGKQSSSSRCLSWQIFAPVTAVIVIIILNNQ